MSKILLRRRLSKMRLKMGTILMIMMQMMVRMMTRLRMREMGRVQVRVRVRVRMKEKRTTTTTMTMKVKRRKKSRMEGGDMISETVRKSVGFLWRKVSKDHDLLEGYCIKEWGRRSIGM
jgi:hypothetical protein